MATPEQLLLQLESIERAIASGATRVSYDGKSVEYRSLADMRAVRDDIKRQLGLLTPPRRTVAGFQSGF